MRSRLLLINLSLFVIAATTLSGCEFVLFDPCPPDLLEEEPFNPEIENVGQMDYDWDLVSGAVLPFPNPASPTEAATRVRLIFETTDAERGNGGCDDVVRSSGNVIALLDTRDLITNETNVQRFTGSFTRDHKSGSTSIRYGKYSVPINKSGNRFTLHTSSLTGLSEKEKAKISWLFQLNLVLEFQRNSMSPINNRVPMSKTPEVR